jgi:Fic family protein
MNQSFTPDLLSQWLEKLPPRFETRYQERFNNESVKSKIDFSFYNIVSAVRSSQIEGSLVDLNSYFNAKPFLSASRKKDVNDIEALISAYEFAQKKPLTEKNLMEAHALLSTHLLSKPYQGVYRVAEMVIRDSNTGTIEYEAARAYDLKRQMRKLFEIVETFKPSSEKVRYREAFYYAALTHLFLVDIHPFADGNGRLSRLCEKWFLSSWIGENAWTITSEAYYHEHLQDYYLNLKRVGFQYDELDYRKSIPFLLMLPDAV